ALNCTVFGLGIAVPSLIGFVYFSKKVEVLSVEMESSVTDLLSTCYYGKIAGARGKAHVPAQTVTPAQPATPEIAPMAYRKLDVCEICSPQTARALHHHRLACRYSDDSPDFLR